MPPDLPRVHILGFYANDLLAGYKEPAYAGRIPKPCVTTSMWRAASAQFCCPEHRIGREGESLSDSFGQATMENIGFVKVIYIDRTRPNLD